MRADRLLSILILLQRHGKLSARRLAGLVGVSVRTIYRDMDALSTAGVPVYTEHGAQGGCCLVDDYRTELTGLTETEASALMLMNVPAPLAGLEIGQSLQSALLKLYAALPKKEAGAAPPGILLDWTPWKPLPASEHISTLYQALTRQCKAAITYRWFNGQLIETRVGVAGLAAKAGDWYAVCCNHGKVTAHAASSLLNVTLTDEPFSPPPGFNLQACWDEICADRALNNRQFVARVRVAPAAVSELRRRCSCQVEENNPDDAGWMTAGVYFNTLEGAIIALLGFGGALRVIEPPALRLALMDYARQVLLQYPEKGP